MVLPQFIKKGMVLSSIEKITGLIDLTTFTSIPSIMMITENGTVTVIEIEYSVFKQTFFSKDRNH